MSKKNKSQKTIEMEQGLFRQETNRNHFSALVFKKHYKYLTDEEKKAIDGYIIDWYKPKWKTVTYNGQELDNYKVSNVGTVINLKTNRILNGGKSEFGYIKVSIIMPDGKVKSPKVHRLVAEAFIPNPENKREVNHIIPVKDFNWVGNLEWASSAENKYHARRHGLYKNASYNRVGQDRPGTRYSDETVRKVCKLLEEGKQPTEIALLLGVPKSLPGCIKYTGKWSHIAKDYNIPKPTKNIKIYPTWLVSDIKKMLEDGMSNRMIIDMYEPSGYKVTNSYLNRLRGMIIRE